jgi:hypothetical protein
VALGQVSHQLLQVSRSVSFPQMLHIHSFIAYNFSNSRFRYIVHINRKLNWRECIKIFHKTKLMFSSQAEGRRLFGSTCAILLT